MCVCPQSTELSEADGKLSGEKKLSRMFVFENPRKHLQLELNADLTTARLQF